MDNLVYRSSSGIIQFLFFQDRLNSLSRFLEKMRDPVDQYVLDYTSSIKKLEESIEEGPEFYELGEFSFTKEEALLGLDFSDNYEGGTGNDADFFPKYFYSSIVILAVSILESLLKDLIKPMEERIGDKWKPDKNPTLISGINYLNKHGFSYKLYDSEGEYEEEYKEYIKLNEIRKHFIHFLYKENFGALTDDELKKYNPTYDLANHSLHTISNIAYDIEKQYIERYD